MNTMRINHIANQLSRLAAAALLLTALAAQATAQSASTDPESPTPMTTNIVTGKSNGKAKTVYYSFVATADDPGEVKIKVTASTDERSTNMRINFLDEDGQKLMDEIYVIPNRDPAVKIGKHTFADRQKVIMRVTLPDDAQVKLLNYKIEVTGAVEFETPPEAAPSEPTPEGDATESASDPSLTSDVSEPTADQVSAQPDAEVAATGKKTLKQKIKATAKKKGKETLKDLLEDNQF
jgi:hypothetical protein